MVALVWLGLGLGGLAFVYALDLPDTDDLWRVERSPEIHIYSAQDTLLDRRGNAGQSRDGLLFADLPPHLVEAVVSIEYRRNFDHIGLDPRGQARAMQVKLRAGRLEQGGSTLTQQLAKNVFLTPERTFKRKVQELLLAFWLEAKLTKQEIIALYLNRVYFGAGAYGVQAAADIYFNRPAQSLTLGEAAILAGLLKAPSRYAPTRDPQARARVPLWCCRPCARPVIWTISRIRKICWLRLLSSRAAIMRRITRLIGQWSNCPILSAVRARIWM